jgi:GDPmannose 4,6-dehydratase
VEISPKARVFHASSGDIFGNTTSFGASEATSHNPQSPYAVAKSIATKLAVIFRDKFGISVTNGILFNHESHLRSDHFFSKKIVESARAIARGDIEQVSVGDLSVYRDFGLAREYVEAMHYALNYCPSGDYVIGTGVATRLDYFVERVFAQFGLNWREFVKINQSDYRPSPITYSVSDPSLFKQMGWNATVYIEALIEELVETLDK